MSRKPITKKLRFEVFKRDSFTCQYCGRMSPDVVLQVDHINPVKNGGDNNILNLVTSCFDCNSGKGARLLSDKDELKKQQEQLKLLSEKKEQLAFMVKWRKELLCLSDEEVNIVEMAISKHNSKFTLNDHGRQSVRDYIKRFTLNAVLDAVDVAYPRYDTDGTSETWNFAFNKIGGICYNNKMNDKDPTYNLKRKARTIFEKKYPIYNHKRVSDAINTIIHDELSYNAFIDLINDSRNWSTFFTNYERQYGDING